jgi:coproporphyrinogen III oxidase-like Fe-S oxidoreductase
MNSIAGGQWPFVETETVNAIDTACQTAVLNLRRIAGIHPREFQQHTGFDVFELFAEPIARYQKLSFIVVTQEAIRLTARALPIADSVVCDFAAL